MINLVEITNYNKILLPVIVLLSTLGTLFFVSLVYAKDRDRKLRLVNVVIASIFSASNIVTTILFLVIKYFSSEITFFVISTLSCTFTFYIIILECTSTFRLLQENNLFIKSIKSSPWNCYLMINKKNKIVKISKPLLDQLGYSSEKTVQGHDLFEVIFQRIRIKTINNITYDNKTFIDKFSDLSNSLKPNEKLPFELCFYNEIGDEVYLKFLLQPMFSLTKFKGIVINGELKSDFKMLGVEKQLQSVTSENDLLTDKFVSLLEVSQEMILFSNLAEQTIWINDRARSELGFSDNQININNFRQLVEPGDLANYDKHLASLTPDNPTYSVKYRINSNGGLYWYEDTGKKIFTKDNVVVVATIKKINTNHFWKTGFDKLDALEGETEMIVKMNELIKEHYYFNVVYLKINNLAEVNQNHGRQAGNLLIAQYIEKLNLAFISDRSQIFRITGSTFAIIITDPRKMDSFKIGARQKSDYLNLVLKMGSIEMFADVYAGIAVFKKDSLYPEELMKKASQALEFALNPQYNGQICFFSKNDAL